MLYLYWLLCIVMFTLPGCLLNLFLYSILLFIFSWIYLSFYIILRLIFTCHCLLILFLKNHQKKHSLRGPFFSASFLTPPRGGVLHMSDTLLWPANRRYTPKYPSEKKVHKSSFLESLKSSLMIPRGLKSTFSWDPFFDPLFCENLYGIL
jgi:hypothetical protein